MPGHRRGPVVPPVEVPGGYIPIGHHDYAEDGYHRDGYGHGWYGDHGYDEADRGMRPDGTDGRRRHEDNQNDDRDGVDW